MKIKFQGCSHQRNPTHPIASLALTLAAWLMHPNPAHCFYNPSTGRWLSRDPLGETAGPNSYPAAANNLVKEIDSLGLLAAEIVAIQLDQAHGSAAYNGTYKQYVVVDDEKRNSQRPLHSGPKDRRAAGTSQLTGKTGASRMQL